MFKQPLIIVSTLQSEERDSVLHFLQRTDVPIYAEAVSGLREHPALRDRLVFSGEALLSEAGFDGVIRIGGVPTLRYWRDLERTYRDLPVQVFSRLPFPGLGRSDVTVKGLKSLDTTEFRCQRGDFAKFFSRDRALYQSHLKQWGQEPLSEQGMFHRLSQVIPRGSRIFLGNSLSIREWDLCATREDRGFEIAANRGANGIDGELSTFYGWAEAGRSNWAILGDLTTLYDLAAPWVLPQLKGVDTHLVVVNNGGGQLFSKLFSQKTFLNSHSLHFDDWARMWGLHYERWESVPENYINEPSHHLIELTVQ